MAFTSTGISFASTSGENVHAEQIAQNISFPWGNLPKLFVQHYTF